MSLITNVNSEKRLEQNEQNEYQTRVKDNVLPYATIATPQDKVSPELLTMFAAGSTWKVTYYRQILGRDEEPTAQSTNRTAVYQQYDRIENFLIRVTDPLTHQQNDQDRIFTVEGGGLVMPAFGPNVGDMFVADAGDGRMGLFTVSYMLRKTALKYSTYEVKYNMVKWMDAERQADLDRKTNNIYYFDPNGWANGCGPFATPAQQNTINDFMVRLPEMIDAYFSDFLSKDSSTLIVPDQEAPTYDHFLTRFILQLVGREWSERIVMVNELNVTANRLIRDSKTIWDALLNRRSFYLDTGIRTAQIGDMRRMRGRPELRAAGYSGVPFIVMPLEHSTHVDEHYRYIDLRENGLYPYRSGQLRRRSTYYDTLPPKAEERAEYQIGENAYTPLSLPKIKPVNCDIFYVLSNEFYTGEGTRSQLEVVTNQVIRKEPIDDKLVANLVEDAYNWTNLERFYYHPILMFIMLLYIRRMNDA